MREYDEIEVTTLEEADTFLLGMRVLLGNTDEEWVVESIAQTTIGTHIITVYKD